MDYVKIKKNRVFVNDGNLFLNNYELNEIREIKKLKQCSNLKGLYLEHNQLTKIEGLGEIIL